jgi:hypothetical protein
MQTLNTQNPDFLTWTHEHIQFDILGGIRLEGLDRLRVTVRATYDGIIIRHNVDLYNDNQLTQLVRKCAERFEMSASFMYPIVGQLVNLLEDYRIKEINALKESSNTKKKELSEEEAEEAQNLLKTPNLLETINVSKAQVFSIKQFLMTVSGQKTQNIFWQTNHRRFS